MEDRDKGMAGTVQRGFPSRANLLNSEAGVGGNRRLSLVSFKRSLSGLPAFPLIAHYNRINNTSREVSEGDAYYTVTCKPNSLTSSLSTITTLEICLSIDFRFLANFHLPSCLRLRFVRGFYNLFVCGGFSFRLEFSLYDDFILSFIVSCRCFDSKLSVLI